MYGTRVRVSQLYALAEISFLSLSSPSRWQAHRLKGATLYFTIEANQQPRNELK